MNIEFKPIVSATRPYLWQEAHNRLSPWVAAGWRDGLLCVVILVVVGGRLCHEVYIEPKDVQRVTVKVGGQLVGVGLLLTSLRKEQLRKAGKSRPYRGQEWSQRHWLQDHAMSNISSCFCNIFLVVGRSGTDQRSREHLIWGGP